MISNKLIVLLIFLPVAGSLRHGAIELCPTIRNADRPESLCDPSWIIADNN